MNVLEKIPTLEPLEFNASPKPTIGVEMEIWQVSKKTRSLVSLASEFLERFADEPFVKKELWQSMLEINTRVCNDVREARQDLAGSIARLERVAAEFDAELISSGTHPFDSWRDQDTSPDIRYHRLLDVHQWPAKRLLISGLHVHVGVSSGEKAIAINNSVASYLPHLQALSASSPFWHGSDTGLASCRSKVFEALPKAGLPPYILNWAEFVKLMRTLLNSKTVDSIRDIWWDVRPHLAFGTIEVRMCDAVPTLRENMAIAALIQALIVRLSELYDQGHPLPVLMRWTLVENKWRAIRHGLDAEIIRNEKGDLVNCRDHLYETIELLRPTAERLGSVEFFDFLPKIIEWGNSAMRQRRVFKETGDMKRVVDLLAWEFANNRILEPGMEKDF